MAEHRTALKHECHATNPQNMQLLPSHFPLLLSPQPQPKTDYSSAALMWLQASENNVGFFSTELMASLLFALQSGVSSWGNQTH